MNNLYLISNPNPDIVKKNSCQIILFLRIRHQHQIRHPSHH